MYGISLYVHIWNWIVFAQMRVSTKQPGHLWTGKIVILHKGLIPGQVAAMIALILLPGYYCIYTYLAEV